MNDADVVGTLGEEIGIGPNTKCLVVGSAPTAVRPAGIDASWKLICVNGSPAVAARIGLPQADIVVLRGGLFKDRQIDVETRAALAGKRAKLALVRGLDKSAGADANAERLAAVGFECERVRGFTTDERDAVRRVALGRFGALLLGRKDISAGLNAVMIAVAAGASQVVVTGISLVAAGHFYNLSRLPRHHIGKDRSALRIMARRSAPLFSTDAALADATGVRLWGCHPPEAKQI